MADRTLIGDPTPDVTYGISLGVSYKGWELGIDMMGQGGNQIYQNLGQLQLSGSTYGAASGPLARRR